MRVHHLDCISMCPLGGALMDGGAPHRLRGRLTCHCLLVETDRGLVLVDTGFGLGDVAAPKKRISDFFLVQVKPELREERTAVRQVERLGFSARDVRHIVLTHLDFDHAGGLDDFPEATVHLLASERDDARARSSWLDRQRYRPQQWKASEARWRAYAPSGGEPWFGFQAVRGLEGVPDDILLVPLRGHTIGHAGVAVRRDDGRWLLHAGDAYFYHAEMDPQRPRCTPGLRAYQRMMEKDRVKRLENRRRLRALHKSHGPEIEIFCAHDVVEFERLAAAGAAPSRDAAEEAGRARDRRGSADERPSVA